MGGAHRKPTLFSRGIPEALRGRDYHVAARTARLSVAVGTALTLAAGSGTAWADAPATSPAGTATGHAGTSTTRVGGPAISAAFPPRGPGMPARRAEPRDEHRVRVPAPDAHAAGARGAQAARARSAQARGAQARGAQGSAAGSVNAALARTGRRHTPAKAGDPITARITRASAAAEAVAERLTEARAALDALTTAQTATAANLAVATTLTDRAEFAAATWTRKSFIAQSSRPEGLVDDPRTGMLGRPEIGTAVLDLEAARAQQHKATDAVDRATAAVTAQRAHVASLRRDLDTRGAELRTLRAAQASALIEAQRRRDAVEAALARKYLRDADGSAGQAALSAVHFALAQRGKPYEWGAEGPDRFDCSGLVQTAYATADVVLPRTARPQYRVTKPVSVTALLPGDLLFFATEHADWNTIHHVGVYLGGGLMVHAPTTGDVVRVAPVWWSEFFAAGRVVPGRPWHRGESSVLAGLRPDRVVRHAVPGPSASTSTPADAATATPMVDASKSASPSPSTSPTTSPSTTPHRPSTPATTDRATTTGKHRSPHRTSSPSPSTATDHRTAASNAGVSGTPAERRGAGSRAKKVGASLSASPDPGVMEPSPPTEPRAPQAPR
ncbi:NlpC/P60 family protein [Cryptosporangium sp. NPDC048952]|uniref:C40 family peptidase n=1 Tax=Cryptosporangium sp. NPDC048952 TaxID=3363961 RepID=UPI00371F6FA4